MGILKRRTVLLVIVCIISILVIGCGISSKESKPEPVESVKQKVVAYLTTKGYKEDDFKLNVKYHKAGVSSYGGPYSINVIFNDEQNVIYNYRYNYKSEPKDITQIGISPLKDKNDKNFKHAEP